MSISFCRGNLKKIIKVAVLLTLVLSFLPPGIALAEPDYDISPAPQAAPPTNIRWGVPIPGWIESGHSIVTPLGSTVSGVTNCDDCSVAVTIDDTIEGGLKFGSTTYDQIYVGSNGYITFGHSFTSFDPVGIPGYANGPMIAGMFDDLHPGNGGDVYIYEDDLNDRVTITWYQVQPYEPPTDGSGVNTFQVRLHGLWNLEGDTGDFGIEIRYDSINWTRGMPADPGDYPTAGWTVGDGATYGEVEDSGTADFITIEDESNVDHPGVFAWGVYNGGVSDVDETINENSSPGTIVAPLTADDDFTPEDNLIFSLLDNDGGNFEIFVDAGVYKVRVASGATLDYETSPGNKRQIQVQATDTNGESSSAWLDIPLRDVNEAPVITEGASISRTMSEDGSPTPFSLTLNAADVDAGDTLNWSISSPASHGNATASGTGISKAISYTPTANYFGLDSFEVEVTDSGGLSDQITVNVTIESVEDAPVAVNDSGSTNEDTSFTTVNVAANDSDPDPGDTLSLLGFDVSATIGNVSDNGNETFDYDPNGQFEYLAVGESTTDSFEYTIQDTTGRTDSATLTVTITGVNDSPTANDDGVSTGADTPFTTADLVAANDTDPDTSDVLSVTGLTTAGTTGLVSNNGDGTFDYDPNGQFESLPAGDSTTDTFGYTISDGNGGSASAIVTVTINGANDPPESQDDSGSTQEDTPVTVDVMANDTDPDSGDTLEIISVTQGTNGTVSFTSGTTGNVTYTPNPNTNGLDSFMYTISDGNGGTDSATVTISVTESLDFDVRGGGISIMNGDSSPSTADDTDFGSTSLFPGTVEHIFTIENLGSEDLVLTGTPRVEITGSHSGDFTVSSMPASPLTSGAATTFAVEFDPSAAGLREATVNIETDDLSAPYTFDIEGTATTNDSDGDGMMDNDEQGGDRDGDGVVNYLDYDPTGYFYDEANGEIISGGLVAASGPGAITTFETGASGYYQFSTDGTAGTYTLTVTLPPGYAWSDVCLQGDPPPYDPTGNPDPDVLGAGENGSTGFLTSNACTAFYLTFDLEAGDPFIFNNNLALRRLPLPDTGFAPGQITELSEQPAELTYQIRNGFWLEVPDLNLHAPLVGVPSDSGEWDITWLGNNAGYLIGSAFPTREGNTVITGHVWNADNQPGIFVDLRTLSYGDKVRIHAWGEIYTYEVTINRRVSPSTPNVVFEHKEGDWITLFTCEDYGEYWGDYGYRRMVQAVLVDVSPAR